MGYLYALWKYITVSDAIKNWMSSNKDGGLSGIFMKKMKKRKIGIWDLLGDTEEAVWVVASRMKILKKWVNLSSKN